MKAIRIKLRQNKACYKKEECDQNKMTYPLPPFSTVIGAIHVACGFKIYHPMDVSVQGSFSSMGSEVYRDHAFLNSLQNDRGMLVKLANENYLSGGFTRVASAQKSQGNDFDKELTIEVHSRECLNEYQEVKEDRRKLDAYKKNVLADKVALLKKEIKALKEVQKTLDKNSEEFKEITEELLSLQAEEKELNNDFKLRKKEIDDRYSKFATLTTSIKHYEVLYGVELVIHIASDEDTLSSIEENIYNMRSLGRSEDFVDIVSCDFVHLSEEVDDVKTNLSAYVKVQNVKDEYVYVRGQKSQGTRYYLNKDYNIKEHKRVFNKHAVLYVSKFNSMGEGGEHTGIYIDGDGYVAHFI